MNYDEQFISISPIKPIRAVKHVKLEKEFTNNKNDEVITNK